jgi:signal transduction histidine kinase
MSHELRTPLNGILGYQNLLLEDLAGSFDPGARVYLEKSNRAALNLLGLVNDILDYAKIEAGKVVLQIRPATMVEIVEDAVANVEPIAVQKGVQLTTPQPDSAVSIHTDPDRVRQILINLLSNAIKFTPKGGEISVTSMVNTADDGVAEFRVRDSGPGVAPEDQEAIFREFEQVKGTKGGTGLGLPISRKLAHLLGGDLRVESAAGDGSTFVLRLPVGRAAEIPAGAA